MNSASIIEVNRFSNMFKEDTDVVRRGRGQGYMTGF